MKAKVYNIQGQESSEIELVDSVFAVPIKQQVVHEVYVAQMNNQREPWADTKNRGEVSGGGKKPWKQKGTGRARHGSIRSPIWKGGGVAFGPLSIRNYATKINKKTRHVAMKMCLSDKLKSGNLIIIDDFNFKEPKTKLFVNFLKSLPTKESSTYLVLTHGVGSNQPLVKMTRNIPRLATQTAKQLSVMQILSKQNIIVSVEGIKQIEKILSA